MCVLRICLVYLCCISCISVVQICVAYLHCISALHVCIAYLCCISLLHNVMAYLYWFSLRICCMLPPHSSMARSYYISVLYVCIASLYCVSMLQIFIASTHDTQFALLSASKGTSSSWKRPLPPTRMRLLPELLLALTRNSKNLTPETPFLYSTSSVSSSKVRTLTVSWTTFMTCERSYLASISFILA